MLVPITHKQAKESKERFICIYQNGATLSAYVCTSRNKAIYARFSGDVSLNGVDEHPERYNFYMFDNA